MPSRARQSAVRRTSSGKHKTPRSKAARPKATKAHRGRVTRKR